MASDALVPQDRERYIIAHSDLYPSRKRSQKGGALLGKGAYGCVFDTKIGECDHVDYRQASPGPETRYVYKLLYDETNYRAEYSIMKTVQEKLGPADMPQMLLACRVSRVYPVVARDCPPRRHSESTDAFQIVYEYGGQTLHDMLHARGKPFPSLCDMIYKLKPVMDCAHELSYNQLVHGDIKPDNLVMKPGGRIRMIDFGLTKEFNNTAETGFESVGIIRELVGQRLRRLDPVMNATYPPELIYKLIVEAKREESHASATLNREEKEGAKDLVAWAYYKRMQRIDHDLIEILGYDQSHSESEIIRQIADQLSPLFGSQQRQSLFRFSRMTSLEDYADRYDVFSLGVLLARIYFKCPPQEDAEITEALKDLIRQACHPNPFERVSMSDFYQRYLHIFALCADHVSEPQQEPVDVFSAPRRQTAQVSRRTAIQPQTFGTTTAPYRPAFL